jgi:hypothetical protein
MDRNLVNPPSFYLAILAALGWFALFSQLYIILQNGTGTVAEIIIRYFSFFTILTNLIVALCATVLLLKPKSKRGDFFSKPSTLTAITVYITIVGVVYNAILRFLWQPQGLQFITDELLHTIIPLLFIFLWLLYVPKQKLKYKNAFPWLLYPFVYIVYIIIRGEITGEYPYPFIDVGQLGYSKMLINCGGLVVAFLGLSLFLIAIGKFAGRNKN